MNGLYSTVSPRGDSLERLEVLHEEGRVERVGVIKVILGALAHGQVTQVLVVRVVRHIRHVLLPQRAEQTLRQRRLPCPAKDGGDPRPPLSEASGDRRCKRHLH
jgi:hypothetical protein